MPLIETTGAASSRGFGQFARSVAANYIEDVFQTWLYTGNNSTQTITNGVDLSTNGGLVWVKARSSGTEGHLLFDTARGVNKYLQSQNTDAQSTVTNTLSAFNTNGFTLGTNGPVTNAVTYASWTFRKQPKFFDVVTYTGNSVNGRLINHSLGSVPGCIIIKRTDTTGDWAVWHVAAGNGRQYLRLNSTDGRSGTANTFWLGAHTSTQFQVGGSSAELDVNLTGGTYVAYLFAHDAGGFGASGTDNVISCGLYAGNAGTNDITLGYEAQWVLIKTISTLSNQVRGGWHIFDMMRGMPTSTTEGALFLDADSTAAETSNTNIRVCPTPTGFQVSGSAEHVNSSSASYIYIAIRRGPMRTPTTGTSVFSPIATTTNMAAGNSYNFGFPADLFYGRGLSAGNGNALTPRLTTKTSFTESTAAELATQYFGFSSAQNLVNVLSTFDNDVDNYVYYGLRRAPGFFDVVCYTGTGANRTVNHNLGVVPEMMIVKCRSTTIGWLVYASALGNTGGLRLDLTNPNLGPVTWWNSTTPTNSVFSLGSSTGNNSGETFVAYLFATVAGVSKVGSYTGTGTTLQVNCGFTGGARFVLIKRTDSTGDWYVWDSARGIVAGNDPYLLLNSTAAEVTSTDYVDTFSSGFEISSTAPAAINANGGTFIFLAVS